MRSKLALATCLVIANISCSGTRSTAETTVAAPSTTVALVEPSTPATDSTTVYAQSGRVGLYRIDPANLQPTEDVPLTRGDWLSGVVSPNDRWLALNVWLDTRPDTDLIRVLDLSTDEVVTEAVFGRPHPGLMVSDAGVVYAMTGDVAPHLSLHALLPGASDWTAAFDNFPIGFEPHTSVMLSNNKIGMLGSYHETTEAETGLALIDLVSGEGVRYPLPEVSSGVVDEHDLGDWTAPEVMNPAVVWDEDRNRALVIHADKQAITEVDLESGATKSHNWGSTASWLDSLMTLLAPRAQAKGPTAGTTRHAALTEDGMTLIVGTSGTDFEFIDNEDWSVAATSQGVDIIEASTWERTAHFDIPASQVAISPSGRHLVATGLTTVEGYSSSTYTGEGAFVIDLLSLAVIGHIEMPGQQWYSTVEFSPEGDLVYLSPFGGRIYIVDLATGEVLDSIIGPEQLAVFGEAGLIVTNPDYYP